MASPGAPGWRIGTSDKLIEGINRKLTKVKTVPYKHNYGYFFTSGPDSWHGMEKKEIKKERRCIQINYVTFETDWKVKS